MRKYIWLFLVMAVAISSCRFMGGRRVRGNGVIKSQDHTVSTFKNVEVSGSMNVYVSQGNIKPVRIEGDENLFDRYFSLKENLEEIFKRKVDVIEERAVKNPFFRKTLNRDRIKVYGA